MIEEIAEKNSYQAQLFTNRLKKKYKELRKWARKNRISCYRLYDRDIPEVPLSLDVYEFLPSSVDSTIECARFLSEQNARISANDPLVEKEIEERRFAVLYLYERPYEKPAEEEEIWFNLMTEQAASALNIPVSHIIKKERRQQKGTSQYEKSEEASQEFTSLIQEQGQLFKINLGSYLDTGLFFDHRPLRAKVREISGGKRVLNLFCYTGSFSVYAASGGAKYVESLDLSNTYLSWAKENLELNGFKGKNYIFTKTDVISWLYEKVKNSSDDEKEKFDIIILDPPTFSNSKSTANVLDINRDWPKLIEQCVKLLSSKGTLYFSTNSTKLIFDAEKIPQKDKVTVTDITAASIPKDFEGTKCHKAWSITLNS
ncbi:class I SAM-dependent methyltransferase [Treponema sp. C6A8]|uniref:class I SAM-dependent methyltransferase n=1 Tax=Treponema sp. C6A8 TaxID=1410609 RepID=UPI000487A28A|nr:class I SAM-dependent methyltransferase [Treponema sp. C6A8]